MQMARQADPYQDETPEPLFTAAYLEQAITEACTTRTPRRWLAKYGSVIPDPRAPLALKKCFREAVKQVEQQIRKHTIAP